MGGVFSANLEAMVSTEQRLADQSQQLKAELDSITHEWGELASTWTGVAASAFDPPFDDWRYGAVTVTALLRDHAETLRFCAAAFAEQERNAAQAVRSIVVPKSPL